MTQGKQPKKLCHAATVHASRRDTFIGFSYKKNPVLSWRDELYLDIPCTEDLIFEICNDVEPLETLGCARVNNARFYNTALDVKLTLADASGAATPSCLHVVITPLSSTEGFAYASVCGGNISNLADKMVTHNWGNIFFHLIAAIVADALDQKTYQEAYNMLVAKKYDQLMEMLHVRGTLNVYYWVCAFCVNQHNGICHHAPPNDSHGVPILKCDCPNKKLKEGARCEMDKFDDMMAHLKAAVRERSRRCNLGPFLASLGFFMCHIYCSIIEQLDVL